MAVHHFVGATRHGQGNTEYRAQVITKKNDIDNLWSASVTIYISRRDGTRVSDDDHFEVAHDFATEQDALNAGATAAAAWGLRR